MIVLPTPVKQVEVVGFTRGTPGLTMVRCESNEDYSKLDYRAEIDEVEHTLDSWNSVQGIAYYKPYFKPAEAE